MLKTKKIPKQIISVMLSVMMVVSIVVLPGTPITAQAGTICATGSGEDTADGMFSYHTKLDGTIIIDKFNGRTADVTIPSEIDGIAVTEIQSYAFSENKILKNVAIPDSVTSIGWYAFYKCSSLTRVSLPISLAFLSDGVFAECTSLEKVVLPESLTEIKQCAFENCTQLEDVNWPDSLTTIGQHAFSNCTNLSDVTIPDSVTDLFSDAFTNTAWQSDMHLNHPNEPLIVGRGILLDPVKDIPDSVKVISGNLYSDCGDIQSITLPSSLEAINYGAFWRCSSLKEIVIPDSVITIGDYAFSNCTSLSKVSLGSSLTEIGYGAFIECSALESIDIPDSVVRIEGEAFHLCEQLKNVKIPDSVKYIGVSAFKDTMWLLSYPDDLVVAGDGVLIAYLGGKADKVVVPNGVKSISSDAFSYAELGEIILPDTIKRIEDYAFEQCSIDKVFIPNSVEYVGVGIVADGRGVEYLRLPNSLDSIDYDFSITPSTGLLMYVPDSVKYITPDWGDPGYYTILCHKNSYIEKYAENKKWNYITIADDISDCNIKLDKSIFEYTGEELKPKITVTGTDYENPDFNNTVPGKNGYFNMPTFPNKATLTEGIDYKVEYKDNIELGEASAVITGIGFYKGSKTLNYSIQKDINRCSVSITPTSFEFDGTPKLPIVSVKDGEKVLAENTDYTVKYNNNTKAGEAELKVIGKGNYYKEKTLRFTIEKTDISTLEAELSQNEFTYSGYEIKPYVTVRTDEAELLESRDYSVEYSNNTEVGKGSVKITGIESCFGEQTFDFTINPRSVEECTFTPDNDALIYDGTEKTPRFTVNYGKINLTEGVDYTVEYRSNVEPGEGVAVITGKGNFTGEKELKFGITKDISTMRTELEYTSTVYDGTQKQPTVKVYDGDTEIDSFNVSYSDNTNAGEAKTVVLGTGNYSGSITKSFTIEKADISGGSIELYPVVYTYDGNEKRPNVMVYDHKHSQISFVSVTYSDNINAGTAKVTAVGTGNYIGTLSAEFTINPQDLTNRKYSLSQTSYAFDGSEKRPEFVVDDETLVKNTDYIVTYENNVNAGTPIAVLTGIGNYTGEVKLGFTITPKFLSALPAALSIGEYKYDGSLKQPEVTITDGDMTLIFGRDYVVNYSDNRNPGTASAVITGTGNYTGAQTKYFNIRKVNDDDDGDRIDISGYAVTLSKLSYVYDGNAKFPSVTVKNGSVVLMQDADYTVSYENNTEVGTAKAVVRGIGIYKGEKTVEFYINKAEPTDISSCSVTLPKSIYNYDGTAKMPSVTVKDGNNTLVYGKDYTVDYLNNINVGTASAVITGIGNYSGSKSVSFTINSAQAADISTCAVIFSRGEFVYDGTPKTPDVTVKLKGVVLEKDKDYTVSYENNINVGKARVIITGIGSYSGKKEATFPIKASNYVKAPFVWGSDNWNFINADYNGDFSADTYRSQISGKYLDALIENLSPSEYQTVFMGSEYSKAWIDENFGGSCYGMSSTTLLAKQGFLPYTEYLANADELHDLTKPTSNSDVSSLITYYQMLQVKRVTQQQYRTIPKKSHEENIKNILALLDNNDTVLLGFCKDGWGGHAILAYDYENGSWTKNNVVYDGRIKICDPNSSNKENEENYIYYNTETYAWTIPAYSGSGISSDKGAVFNYIGADVDVINQGGWLTGVEANNRDNYVARIDAFSISDNRYVSKVQIGANGNYTMMNNAPGDIEEDYSYVLGNESEGTVGYNLYDADASYCITQGSTDKLETAIQYEDALLIGGTSAGKSVLFDKSGYVEVHGKSSDYSMTITSDDEHPTDWFTVSVKGKDADLSSIKQVDNGWVVASDNLDQVEVTVNNKYVVASTTFSTEYPSALIYEVDENTIGIAVDRDDNGTYETTLGTKTSMQDSSFNDKISISGDLDGDSDITASDALIILRSSVGLEDLTSNQIKIADIDNDGDVTANDALEVLRYSVGLSQNEKIAKAISGKPAA